MGSPNISDPETESHFKEIETEFQRLIDSNQRKKSDWLRTKYPFLVVSHFIFAVFVLYAIDIAASENLLKQAFEYAWVSGFVLIIISFLWPLFLFKELHTPPRVEDALANVFVEITKDKVLTDEEATELFIRWYHQHYPRSKSQ